MSERPEMKTEDLAAKDLRPCSFCGGPIVPIFYCIDVRMAVVNAQNANQLLGMNQFFGGKPETMKIAEVFTPGADRLAAICDDPELKNRLFACVDCYTMKPLDLAIAAEKRNKSIEAESRASSADES
jgi:hypothetical protein